MPATDQPDQPDLLAAALAAISERALAPPTAADVAAAQGFPVPLLPGFHPDPSVTRVDGIYYVVSSTFAYCPGIPVFASTDLEAWSLIGHVVTRPAQRADAPVPTMGGIWAPTIRHHDGVFHVIVTDVLGRGTVVFRADDPAGPWSDGTPIGIDGIDPDLAWDDDGTCYLTYSGMQLTGAHQGIRQVRVDLASGTVLTEPRALWSGTGGIFPEGPHLHRVGEWWYLLIAEGGTERGHAVSIARARSPEGPFEGCPANPVLTARGTDLPAQCVGHADLVQTPDGGWALLTLGVWVCGRSRSFGPLGRETFATRVTWRDGWPLIAPVGARRRTALAPFTDDFDADRLAPDWIAVRAFPDTIGRIEAGELVIDGSGATMDDPQPAFVGRRQTRLDAAISVRLRRSTPATVGGLTVRFDEHHHYDVEWQPGRVVGRAVIPSIRQEHSFDTDDDAVELALVFRRPQTFGEMASCDLIDLVATTSAGRHVVATFDGRYLSTESAVSFTGRVVGCYCVTGQLRADRYRETDR